MNMPINDSMKNKSGKIKMSVIAALILLPFICILFWAIFGASNDKKDVSVKAALINAGKIVSVYALEDAVIADFSISPQQYVEKGFIIARIEQAGIISEIYELLDKNPQDQENLEAKRKELLERSLVASPEAGRVVETYVSAGDFVSKGTKIATISKEAKGGKALECRLFVPASKMTNVQKDLSVHVYPSGASVKKYGSLTGTITYVSNFPVTKNEMVTLLGSETLADAYLTTEALYEVHATLDISADTMTGYKWTKSSGPSYKFGDLVLCDATIQIAR